MFNIMMLYSGPDQFSLRGDIRRIIPELSLEATKEILAGDALVEVTEEQYQALLKLCRLYATFEIERS